MLNKMLHGAMIGAGCLLFSTAVLADTATGMPKDKWLANLKDVVAPIICKSFTGSQEVNKQLVAANINYDKCVTLIPAIYDKCQAQYMAEIPATLDSKSGEKWGNSLGQCIGADFATQYFISTPPAKSTTDANSTSDASTTSTSSTGVSMSKDVWLGKLKIAVPDLICKGFLKDASLSKQLATLKIDYDKCLTLIPPSIEKCQTELYSSIPATIDDKSAETWGSSIGECIGKDFAVKYLL
jgi:hypothetical protein